MGFMEAAIIGSTAAMAATGAASAAMSGGGGGSSRLKLPGPEEEVAYLRRTEKQLGDIDTEIEKTKTVETTLQERYDYAMKITKAAIPDEKDVKALNATTMKLATTFAGGAVEAVKKRFMTDADAAAYEEMKALTAQNFEDQTMKQSLSDDRKRLASSLRMANASPSQIQDRLAKFDAQATAMMQARSEQMRTERTGQIATREQVRLGMRAEGLNESLQGYNMAAGELSRISGNTALYSQLATASGQASLEGIKTRSALRGEQMGLYTTMGSMDFSKQGKQALESGLVGPGTVYAQTGVTRKDMGEFAGIQRDWEDTQVDPMWKQMKGEGGFVRPGGYPLIEGEPRKYIAARQREKGYV